VPVSAGIVAAADTLHALISDRPYRKGCPIDVAMREIERVKGTQLRSDVVEALERVLPTVERALATPIPIDQPLDGQDKTRTHPHEAAG
jgi:HD-GYP domain-containing protein (c-di-GMP phosphodiesterase class II)